MRDGLTQHDVFIIHADEDTAVAQRLAHALRRDGYRTDFHRRDAGAEGRLHSGDPDPIQRSRCVAILISPHAYASNEIDDDVVHAQQSHKPLMPVLWGVSPADWEQRKPEWRAAIGAASPLSLVRATSIGGALPQIRRSLTALGIRPQQTAAERPSANEEATSEASPPARDAGQTGRPPSGDAGLAVTLNADEAPSDIFVSYAREDRDRVQQLAKALRQSGWTVWWDRNVVPGARFRDVISHQLETARCVVVVWSAYAVNSDWVLDEAADAKDRGKMIAVRIDDVALPFGFRQVQTANLVDWAGDAEEQQFRTLVAAAQSLIRRGPVIFQPPPGWLEALHRLLRKGLLGRRTTKALAWAAAVAVAVVVTVYARREFGDADERLKVAVMEFEAPQLAPEDAWIPATTRARINAMLCDFGRPRLDVKSEEMVAFACKDLDKIACAQKLGINKMISGKIATSNAGVFLEVRVVDVPHGGSLEHSFPHESPRKGLGELETAVAADLLAAFQISLTPEQKQLLLASATKGTSDTYRNFYDSLPVADEEAQPMSLLVRPDRPRALAWGVARAWAQEPPSPEKAGILELLRQYEEALQAKDVDRCGALQVEMNDRQRESLRRYFDNAENLQVQISDVDVAVQGDEAVATFTRRDEFKEVPTGRDVQLEVRLSSLLTKQNGRWKIRGLRKPS